MVVNIGAPQYLVDVYCTSIITLMYVWCMCYHTGRFDEGKLFLKKIIPPMSRICQHYMLTDKCDGCVCESEQKIHVLALIINTKHN